MYIHGRRIDYSTEDEYSGRWFFPRYSDKIHEPKSTELLIRLSQDAENGIDVGANLGWFACIAASISSATVHAFELDEDNLYRLNTGELSPVGACKNCSYLASGPLRNYLKTPLVLRAAAFPPRGVPLHRCIAENTAASRALRREKSLALASPLGSEIVP